MFSYQLFKYNWLARRSFQHASYAVFLLFSILSILEITYQYQVVDFYKSELEGLNSTQELNQDGDKLLVIGDSFSAHPESYVRILKDSLSTDSYAIINASVPGTGLKQQRLILKKRLDQFEVDHLILQVYLGNDLIDLHHPINWSKMSLSRNAYWLLGDVFQIVPYINYRLKPLKNSGKSTMNSEKELTSYHALTQLYIESNPKIYDDMFSLREDWQDVYDKWKAKLQDMISNCDNAKITLLVFPHCTQTHASYRHKYEKLGATFSGNLHAINKAIKDDFSDVHLIDLSAYIGNEEQNGHKMYYENDPHLNLEGQAKVGLYVLNALNDQ